MNQSKQEKLMQNSVAMTVALISFGMLFASLFLGYFLVRFNSPVWPPVEIEKLPQLLPLISTLVMLFSSFTYLMMEKKALAEESTGKIWWWSTFSLGIAFLGTQWTLWATLKDTGILVSNGIVPSMVYAFTWLHAAHIVLALGALVWLSRFVFFKRADLTEIKLMNVGKFWHFLGVVWIIMYLMMFVL
jgi:cytochrome c oxidase subunit III